MNAVNKIVLGTVQFGLNYGINNVSGQVEPKEVEAILKLAYENGIRTLDTSAAYGNSEIVLGEALDLSNHSFNVISKFPQGERGARDVFNNSLVNLRVKGIYGYLVHHFDHYISHPEVWEDMSFLKKQGFIKKIGFSLYTVSQLQYLLDNKVQFDILQLPYNLLDRQFEPFFEKLKSNGVEIHTRSVFLQGLFFKELATFSNRLSPLKPYLMKLHKCCDHFHLSMEQLSLNYVVSNPNIDGVLIGVDNSSQLKANFVALQSGISKDAVQLVNMIKVKETELLNPVNWK